jgi:hypothetical protein
VLFASGWMRLWLVSTAILLGGVAIAGAYYVWGTDACYTFDSVSVHAENASEADKQLVAFIKKAATTNTFCGTTQWSTLLTLEDLAHRGLVQQVAFQWLEPSGWSLKLDKLDILNTSEITTKEIIRRVTQYVQHARLMSALWWMGASLCLAVVVRWSAWESLGCEEASPPLSLGSIHEHSAKR